MFTSISNDILPLKYKHHFTQWKDCCSVSVTKENTLMIYCSHANTNRSWEKKKRVHDRQLFYFILLYDIWGFDTTRVDSIFCPRRKSNMTWPRKIKIKQHDWFSYVQGNDGTAACPMKERVFVIILLLIIMCQENILQFYLQMYTIRTEIYFVAVGS